MTFKLKASFVFIVALTCAGLSLPAKADTNTYLYIAHAAGGRNVSSTTNPEFPLDLSIGGVCVAKAVPYGDVLGPYSGPAGSFSVKISPASIASPCGNAPIFTLQAGFSAGVSYLGVLTFDATNTLRLDVVNVDLSAIPAGQGRILVLNSSAQELSASVSLGTAHTNVNVAAGASVTTNAPAGVYTATITAPGSPTVEAGPALVPVSSRDLYIYVLAGSTTNHTVQLFGPKIVHGVF